ncbi:tetratricopeptide repeat protein, partial [Fulvivirga sp. 29W222]
MLRLITLTVFSMLFFTACTQEDIYTHDPAKLETLKSIHQTYLNHYDEPAVAFELLEKIKVLAIELDNKEYLAKYYANHAYLNRTANQYGEAIKSNKLALALYEQLNDPLRQAKAASNLGNVYRLADKPTEAIHYLEHARELYMQLDQPQKLPGIYDNISLVYMGLQQFDKAEHYVSKSLEAGIALESTYWISNAYINYGEMYFRQQRF